MLIKNKNGERQRPSCGANCKIERVWWDLMTSESCKKHVYRMIGWFRILIREPILRGNKPGLDGRKLERKGR